MTEKLRATLRHGDLVGPTWIYPGVPYSVSIPPDSYGEVHGYFTEDKLSASVPEDTVIHLHRVYLLETQYDPFGVKVLSVTGKVYKISPEMMHRAEWVRLT